MLKNQNLSENDKKKIRLVRGTPRNTRAVINHKLFHVFQFHVRGNCYELHESSKSTAHISHT